MRLDLACICGECWRGPVPEESMEYILWHWCKAHAHCYDKPAEQLTLIDPTPELAALKERMK